MTTIRVLTEADLRAAVGFGRGELEAVEAVFPLVSARAGSMPPIMRIDVPDHRGEVDIKAARLPGYAGIAVKVSSGFFDNPTRGLPSLSGLMVLLDAETGLPLGALFDNGYLTDLRTALAGAVAADHLATADATHVGLIGAGVQARMQLTALRLVRHVTHATVWARDAERAARFVDEMGAALGLTIEAASSPAEAAGDADVLVTTTPAEHAIVGVDALHPGLHVTAVGSDAEHKQELDPAILRRADAVVVDHREQSLRLGELRAAAAAGVDVGSVVELGAVISGQAPGRSSDRQITVCDLTGTGAQDTAIATLAFERCVATGAGTRVET